MIFLLKLNTEDFGEARVIILKLESVQGGSSTRGRSVNRRYNRGRVVVRDTTSNSESAVGGEDTGSDDDIIELGETTRCEEKQDDDGGLDVVELNTGADYSPMVQKLKNPTHSVFHWVEYTRKLGNRPGESYIINKLCEPI